MTALCRSTTTSTASRPDIDISVEAQIPPDNVYTGAEWSKIQVERIHHYLTRYYASKAK